MIQDISIELLVANDYNPRKHFDDARMKELEKSIGNQGIVTAITVRPLNGKYEVVAGMRRFMAARKAGLASIPALVRELSDEEAMLVSITENLERADLTPIEEAKAFQGYLGWDEQHHFEDGQAKGIRLLVDGLAKKLPISVPTIYNRLTLLHLPEALQIKVEQGELSIKVAEAIARLKNLWEIKTETLTPEEIEKRRPEIKTEIHRRMESIADTVKDEAQARDRVNEIIKAEKQNLDQKKSSVSRLKNDYEEAEKQLQEYIKNAEPEYTPTDFHQMDTLQKANWYLNYLDRKINQVSNENLDKLNKERAMKISQHDRYQMNLEYVKELVLDICPHCGAGVNAQNLEKRINELNTDIKALNAQENEAGSELREYRTQKTKLEKLVREHNSKEKVYKSGLQTGSF